jgi:predicted ATPase
MMANAASVFLPNNAWESYHNLTYNIHLELAVNQYLNKNFQEAEHLFSECLLRAKYEKKVRKLFILRDLFQKIRVYEQRTSFYIEKMQYQECLNTALESLELLGVHVPTKVDLEQIKTGNRKSFLIINFLAISRVYSLLGNRSPMDLLKLPQMTDTTYVAMATMLNKSLTTSFFTDIDLALYLGANLVSLSILHGNSTYACFGYIFFGWLEKGKFSRFDTVVEWGLLGLTLCENYSKDKVMADRGQVWNLHGGRKFFQNILIFSSYKLAQKPHFYGYRSP